jgi:hypothetical protein
LPGGSIGPEYILQLLFIEKSQKANNSTNAKAREKISAYLEFLEF